MSSNEDTFQGDEQAKVDECLQQMKVENRLKQWRKMPSKEDNQKSWPLAHVLERPITVHYEDSDKGTVFGKFFTDRPGIDILYYPGKRDDKGELIKAGHYVLLRRATLLIQHENEKFYSLGDYVAVRSETNDWFMCVISEINDPSNEVEVKFMKKSGWYFFPDKKLEKWFPN